jgi:sialidase-1
LSISKDNGKTWSAEKTIYKGPAAYSALSLLENGDLAVFFEKDDYTQNSFVRIPKDQILSLLE